MPDCACCDSGIEKTAEHVFYCRWIRMLWDYVACIDPKQLVQLNVSYIVDNIDTLWVSVKQRVFLMILAIARMVIWQTRLKELYDGASFSDYDLMLF